MLDVHSVAVFLGVVVVALLIVLWVLRREHDQEISNLEDQHRADYARLSGEYMKLRDRERAFLGEFRGTVDSRWADRFVEKYREQLFSSVKDHGFKSVWWNSEI